ncbi:MAG: protein kinase [Cyanothece sp. SIO2G6]|nr:protein kinase [Cyanothece sp. SIO2G6]
MLGILGTGQHALHPDSSHPPPAMSYCLNLRCQHPTNPDTAQYCQHCGDRLRLKERYRPLQLLGKGGFGRTFLAVDDDIPSKPQCVIKQLYFSNEDTDHRQKAIALFQQEAVRLDELGRHPQIPQLLAHFTQDDTLYLVQEFVDGPTLRQAKQNQGCFDEAQIWQLLLDLLPVLDFIHQRRVIHRDIKPDNVIYSRQSQRYMLIDFGVAKLVSHTNWMQTGTVIGSPEYMAPEQTRGKTVPATDLYSLGVTCLAMMTTVSPIDMFDIIDNRWVWRDFVVGTQRVSDRLGQILDKLLESALSQRYQSAKAVLDAIAVPSAKSPTTLPDSPTPSPATATSTAPSQPPSPPPPDITTVEPAPAPAIPSAPAFPSNLGQAAPTQISLSPAVVPPPPPFPTNLGQIVVKGQAMVQPEPRTQSAPTPTPTPDHPPIPAPLPIQIPIPPPTSPQLLQRVFSHFKSPKNQTRIVSQQGVDYTPLYEILRRSLWLQADQHTKGLMNQAIGNTHHGYLQQQDIQNLPCDDLAILDHLWRTFSNGRFGFMVQLQLFLAVNEDYGAFCHQVSWPVHRTPGKYLQPSLKAPPGHFPSRDWAGGSKWWNHLEWMQQRWHNCHQSFGMP